MGTRQELRGSGLRENYMHLGNIHKCIKLERADADTGGVTGVTIQNRYYVNKTSKQAGWQQQ